MIYVIYLREMLNNLLCECMVWSKKNHMIKLERIEFLFFTYIIPLKIYLSVHKEHRVFQKKFTITILYTEQNIGMHL